MVSGGNRTITKVDGGSLTTLVDGDGPALVVLPSYGRDGGEDYDDFTTRAVAKGWRVVRPQPRGVMDATAPIGSQTFHDLADDVAAAIKIHAEGPVVLIGHAFGNLLARVVTTDHSDAVRAVALVASQSRDVPPRIAQAPFVVGDPTRPERERLATLREAFFAPGNDATVWLDGWYPATLAMQHAAVRSVPQQDYWQCGNVPLLEVIPDHDAFKPKKSWQEMRDDLGDRVTTAVVANAGHALFPERPADAAHTILGWAQRFK